jgi:leucyl aminopeptidase
MPHTRFSGALKERNQRKSMKIEITKSAIESLTTEYGTDTLVVFVAKKSEGKNGSKGQAKASQMKAKSTKKTVDSRPVNTTYVEGLSKAVQAKITASADEGMVTGAANETVFFRDAGLTGARHLLTVGLGDLNSLSPETLRQAAASVVNCLKSNKSKSAALVLDSLPHNSLSADSTAQALTEGALMADYSFQDFKEVKPDIKSLETLLFVSSHKAKAHDRGVEVGMVLSECVNFARRLGDRPGNRMTPTMMADETVKAAKGTKLKVNIWDRARIKSEKMGSFLSVAMGSTQEPRFIMMEYNGASSTKKPICFVGKGLTFDCGGISIKPSSGMEEMKYDMCGGAAVIATMLAIARLKLNVNAIGFVPSTENLVGPAATKPGDIVVARNGKTIEVNNTDAEGRLILADALVYACEQDPACIFDIATLTGAMVVALGNIHTGFFTRNDKMAEKIQAAAEATGELVWRMPLTDFHAKDMKGTYADLSNISSGKGAGSSTAAGFLEQFVAKEIPWVHFDIAGTGWHVGDRLPYCPRKGASGVMVRTFVQAAIDQM